MPIIINFLFFNKIQTITINNRLKCYSDIYKEYGTSFIEFTKSYMNEVIYDSRYKLYNCKIYICYISFIDIIFSFNCHSFKLQSPKFNNLSCLSPPWSTTYIAHARGWEYSSRTKAPALSRTAAQVSLAGFFRWRALVAV